VIQLGYMQEVKFEDNLKVEFKPRPTKPTLAQKLVSMGFAKTPEGAEKLMLITSLLAIILSLYFIFKGGDPATQIPQPPSPYSERVQ
jgi:hypothetical protein